MIRWGDTHVSPLDLLAQLATDSEMKRVGRGYLGWCPFHDERASDEQGRPGSPSFYLVQDRRYGWSWRCLSTNCEQHEGPMRHRFRLFQELSRLTAAAAVREAIAWWPESGRALPLYPLGTDDTNKIYDTHERSAGDAAEDSPRR